MAIFNRLGNRWNHARWHIHRPDPHYHPKLIEQVLQLVRLSKGKFRRFLQDRLQGSVSKPSSPQPQDSSCSGGPYNAK